MAKVPVSPGVGSNQTVAVTPMRPPTVPPQGPQTGYVERPQPVEPKKSTAGAWLAVIALIVIVAGGFAGFSFLAGSKQVALKPNEKLRTLMPGDTFTYEVTAVSDVNDNPLLGGRGKAKMTYRIGEADSKVGVDNLRRFRLNMEMEGNNGFTIKQESWYAQDAANNLYYLGEIHGIEGWDIIEDKQPPLEMPAVPAQATSWKYTAHFKSGAVRDFSCKLVGKEAVTTAIGTFECCKFHVKQTGSDGSTQEGDLWVTPWNPFGIKSDLKGEVSFGGLSIKSHLQMELTKCSFKP